MVDAYQRSYTPQYAPPKAPAEVGYEQMSDAEVADLMSDAKPASWDTYEAAVAAHRDRK